MNIDEYTSLDATGLASAIRSGQISHDEATAAATSAIGAVNQQLNAVADGPFPPLAYSANGPFAGVPFVIKDLVCHAAGVPTRMGTRMLGEGVVPTEDTHLMTLFRQAGLATLAVSTTPEFGFNANTEALAYGPTRNPWNLAHSAGGSSGGSGALVAAGAVPVAHANDGGGSIRIPAAYNGLVGLKPSRGRVPLGPDLGDALSGFAIEFAVTRSVRDAAALLDQVSRPFPGDRFVIAPPSRPWRDELGTDPGALRIAVHTRSWAGSHVDPEVAAATESVGQVLEAAGHHVEPATPVFDWEQFMGANVVIWSAFLAESVAAVEAMTQTPAGPGNLEATTWACVEYGRRVSALDLGAANAVINTVSRELGRFFTEYDVLLTPTTNTPAPALGVLDADADLDAEGWTRRIFEHCSFTPLLNATGTPGISLPLAQSSGGLPIGIQLAGPMCSEDLLLRLSAQLENALPWAGRRPPIHAANR